MPPSLREQLQVDHGEQFRAFLRTDFQAALIADQDFVALMPACFLVEELAGFGSQSMARDSPVLSEAAKAAKAAIARYLPSFLPQ